MKPDFKIPLWPRPDRLPTLKEYERWLEQEHVKAMNGKCFQLANEIMQAHTWLTTFLDEVVKE
jgi:hypothetical protein